ncbi:MAG TPA: hypothetical protein VHL57_02815, partial [Flavobacteriales bacterium]|nr:hypothetical protein [Flavobacteriales bacterium]
MKGAYLLRVAALAITLCGILPVTRAQLQFIPEPWMRQWLNELAPGCVDGNGYLDPEFPALASVTTVSMAPNCLNLTGLEYLHHLRDLRIMCMGAGIITPTLPDSLERLRMDMFGFTGPLTLPANLRYFATDPYWEGALTGPMPVALDTFIYVTGYHVLPFASFPNGLKYLEISAHRITGLDAFPLSLRTIKLRCDSAICLPQLPAQMDHVE